MVANIQKPVTPPTTYDKENWWWHDERGVRYVVSDDVLYLTTHQLAKELRMYPETLFRWCRKWFGDLPPGRDGARMGYRIPLEYRLVARAWLQTEDMRVREVARRAIVESPKNFVVVVANIGSTHYTDREVVGRIESLTTVPTFRGHAISVIYVGDEIVWSDVASKEIDQLVPFQQANTRKVM